MPEVKDSNVVVPAEIEIEAREVVRYSKDLDSIPSPFFATAGSAGFDVSAKEGGVIRPGETVLVDTGLRFEIPIGSYLSIVPRSGLSLKTSLWLRNSPGTLDSDYRGTLGLILSNYGNPYRDFFLFGFGIFLAVVFFAQMDTLFRSLQAELFFGESFISLGVAYFLTVILFPCLTLILFGWLLLRSSSFYYKQGDRLAQCVILKHANYVFKEVTEGELSATQRGDGGYGHTGVRANH
jgi:deoxyuridine 5'-triphosphate nucleotidohydrolase